MICIVCGLEKGDTPKDWYCSKPPVCIVCERSGDAEKIYEDQYFLTLSALRECGYPLGDHDNLPEKVRNLCAIIKSRGQLLEKEGGE